VIPEAIREHVIMKHINGTMARPLDRTEQNHPRFSFISHLLSWLSLVFMSGQSSHEDIDPSAEASAPAP
jgi:hypothetical protein